MFTRNLIPCLILAAAPLACGGDPNTSITDGGSSTGTSVGPGTDSSGGAIPPVTEGSGESGVTTGSASGTGDTGTETGSESSPTEPDTFGSSTSSASNTTTTGATDTGTDNTGSSAADVSSSSASTGDGAIESCDELKAAFAAEAQEIRSCDVDAECGVELKGTSCGCTHNWVARLDADTAHFFELLNMADEFRCELILAGICNCPEAEGFACVENTCTWNYL